jgi:transcriptional regulator with XRE-family HTH domain
MQIQPYPDGHLLPQMHCPMPRSKTQSTDFGTRLTALRKAAGYTQVELAAALGTTQRMITYYETRAEKAPAALLPELAQVLGVSADELLGIKPMKRTKKPDTRLQRRIQQIEQLDAREKRQILALLDTFIDRDKLKRRAQTKQTAG